jgi:hypothetical protein
MKALTYEQKQAAAMDQTARIEKAAGKPGPRFNQYMKMRKAIHKSVGGKHATK